MSWDNEKSKELGRIGEDKVAKYLKNHGYIILKRNWRDRYGEIDIIAENDENIVFVEVKTRSEGAIVSGFEAIDAGKIRRTKNMAQMFVNRLNTDLQPRMDVAEVEVLKNEHGEEIWKLNYVKSAY